MYELVSQIVFGELNYVKNIHAYNIFGHADKCRINVNIVSSIKKNLFLCLKPGMHLMFTKSRMGH